MAIQLSSSHNLRTHIHERHALLRPAQDIHEYMHLEIKLNIHLGYGPNGHGTEKLRLVSDCISSINTRRIEASYPPSRVTLVPEVNACTWLYAFHAYSAPLYATRAITKEEFDYATFKYPGLSNVSIRVTAGKPVGYTGPVPHQGVYTRIEFESRFREVAKKVGMTLP